MITDDRFFKQVTLCSLMYFEELNFCRGNLCSSSLSTRTHYLTSRWLIIWHFRWKCVRKFRSGFMNLCSVTISHYVGIFVTGIDYNVWICWGFRPNKLLLTVEFAYIKYNRWLRFLFMVGHYPFWWLSMIISFDKLLYLT